MAGINLIIFRDNGKQVPTADLLCKLGNAIGRLPNRCAAEALIDAVLLAGQVESALSDSDWPSSHRAEAVTNWLAARVVGSQLDEWQLRHRLAQLENAGLPTRIRISPAEGFAYYALHPADFADAAILSRCEKRIAIVGIRSIGTVLSAIAIAALNAVGIVADRITVRPQGHPYNRTLTLNNRQTSWVLKQRREDSVFLIVDEGPGLSGSSFLATAEALVACGVHPNQITLMGTRDVDPRQLCARDAASRWARFHWKKVSSRLYGNFSHLTFVGGGCWRSRLLPPGLEWPPCWPEMERLKFLSPDRRQVFKFEGFGESGAQARESARALSEAGFGPSCESAGSGMSAYQLDASPLNRVDCTPAMLERIARYCAFRISEFKTHSTGGNELEEMTHFNFAQAFGWELALPRGSLEPSDAAIVDGRMQPHEWIATAEGTLLKVDAATHGHDHFMPGPTDIVWDLAGTVAEWNLDRDAQALLLSRFQSLSGIDARDRFHYFLLAYSVFRMSYCRMAASATGSRNEQLRLRQACEFYRRRVTATCRTLNIQRT